MIGISSIVWMRESSGAGAGVPSESIQKECRYSGESTLNRSPPLCGQGMVGFRSIKLSPITRVDPSSLELSLRVPESRRRHSREGEMKPFFPAAAVACAAVCIRIGVNTGLDIVSEAPDHRFSMPVTVTDKRHCAPNGSQ